MSRKKTQVITDSSPIVEEVPDRDPFETTKEKVVKSNNTFKSSVCVFIGVTFLFTLLVKRWDGVCVRVRFMYR
jgi:hypothetical protein